MRNYQCAVGVAFLLLAGCGSDNANEIESDNHANETERDDQAPGVQEVYTESGAIQCDRPYVPASETAQTLVAAGIDVKSSQCIRFEHDIAGGCGFGTNTAHLHTIPTQNAADAEELGFYPLDEVGSGDVGGSGYERFDCERLQIDPAPEEPFSVQSYTYRVQSTTLPFEGGEWVIDVVDNEVVDAEYLGAETAEEVDLSTVATIDHLRHDIYNCVSHWDSCTIEELAYDPQYHYPSVFRSSGEIEYEFQILEFEPQS